MSSLNETAAAKSRHTITEDFSFLGLGGKKDRLNFPMVLHIFRRSLPFLRPVYRHVWIFICISITLSLCGIGLFFIYYQILFSSILQGKPLSAITAWLLRLDPAVYVTVEKLSADIRLELRWDAISLVTLMVPMFALGAGLAYYRMWIMQRINQVLRVQLIERIQAMSMRFHSSTKVGDAIYRVYQDSAMVTNIIQLLIIDPIMIFFTLGFGVVTAGLFDPWLALIIIVTIIPSLVLGARFSPKMRSGFRTMRETNSELTSQIQESIAGIKVIKACGSEKAYQEKFEARSLSAFSAAFGARYRLALFGMLAFLVTVLGALIGEARLVWITADEAAVWGVFVLASFGFSKFDVGSYEVARGQTGAGLSNIEGVIQLWGRLQDMAIGLDRVFDLLDLEVEVQDEPDAMEVPAFKKSITYENVRFGYRSDTMIVKNITLEAMTGQITALVGPTGSGKTTLVALLLHLYELNDGAIKIDGLDIGRFKLESLRRNIAIALQENILFGTTVRENIRYAVPDAGDEQVTAAARIACADDFIRALPQGYDTPLGERGAKLSTGERQRLSIARALIKDAPILVLDEPTASLDAETELAVIKNLTEWGKDRAILLITHRLSTIRQADQIVYLRDGTIVETGSHEDLMGKSGGAYRRLVEMEDSDGLMALPTAKEVS